MKCAFVGAGAVAEKYASGIPESILELTAVCDREYERAEQLAAANDAKPYTDLDALLRDESAPLVVNLTSHRAHATVTRDCLAAGRHVFSEKPLALDVDEATALVSMADRRGLALGCAPINHLGEAQRHVERFLGDSRFGPIRLGYAHAHVGRVTGWHDSPDSYLSVGPLYDGTVYPLNLLIRWFGSVTRVRSADAIDVWPDHATPSPDRPPHVESTVEFESGLVVRLTASFYVPHRSREFYGLELHGDGGSLYLADSGAFVADTNDVRVGGLGREYVAAPSPHPGRELSYVDGPERLALSVGRGNRPTADAKRGAHVVAICNAIETADSEGGPVTVVARDVAHRSLETVS
ncbi:MAG: Gfo/Idh/MocA family protein, partial [Halodesulfurarchaeum sp.]